MSSFIVENKTINRIVNLFYFAGFEGSAILKSEIWRKLKKEGFNFDFEEEKHVCEKLGKAMIEMNCKAVNERYGKKDNKHCCEAIKSYKYESTSKTPLIQAFKSLNCFLYQCCEGDVPKMKLYKVLKQIENSIAFHIVAELPEYNQAEWR